MEFIQLMKTFVMRVERGLASTNDCDDVGMEEHCSYAQAPNVWDTDVNIGKLKVCKPRCAMDRTGLVA